MADEEAEGIAPSAELIRSTRDVRDIAQAIGWAQTAELPIWNRIRYHYWLRRVLRQLNIYLRVVYPDDHEAQEDDWRMLNVHDETVENLESIIAEFLQGRALRTSMRERIEVELVIRRLRGALHAELRAKKRVEERLGTVVGR